MASHETVGTPGEPLNIRLILLDYICPEILRAHEGTTHLDETCDWWSLGKLLVNDIFILKGFAFLNCCTMKFLFTLKRWLKHMEGLWTMMYAFLLKDFDGFRNTLKFQTLEKSLENRLIS